MAVLTKKTTAVKHPLNFLEVYQDIALELEEQPNIGIVRSEINKVIRRVNDELGLWREMVRVAAGLLQTGWETQKINWELSQGRDWDEWGAFRFGWDYDATEKLLRLSDIVVAVEDVYIDDIRWKCVEYEKARASENASEKIYAKIGRYIYFPFDLIDSGKTVDIRVQQSYSFIESTVDSETSIDLPEAYRQLLISGSLMAITSRGKTKDPDLYKHNKEIFNSEYMALKTQYYNLEKPENLDLEYQYY